MPTRTVRVDPELYLKHQEIRVYHIYHNDDLDQGPTAYWFTVEPACGAEDAQCGQNPCRHVFDVRELPTWQPPSQPPLCIGKDDNPENYRAWENYWQLLDPATRSAIIAAIDQKILTTAGTAHPTITPHRSRTPLSGSLHVQNPRSEFSGG